MAAGSHLRKKCPHCGAGCGVRSSRAVGPTYSQLYLQCSDIECGATYGGSLEITHQISASAKPNPTIELRSVPPRTRQLPIPANDEGALGGACGPEVSPPAADNDDGHCGEAVATGA